MGDLEADSEAVQSIGKIIRPFPVFALTLIPRLSSQPYRKFPRFVTDFQEACDRAFIRVTGRSIKIENN